MINPLTENATDDHPAWIQTPVARIPLYNEEGLHLHILGIQGKLLSGMSFRQGSNSHGTKAQAYFRFLQGPYCSHYSLLYLVLNFIQ